MIAYFNTRTAVVDENGTLVRTARVFWLNNMEVFVVRTVADPRIGYVVTVDADPGAFAVIQGWFGPGQRWQDQHALLRDLAEAENTFR